MNFHPAIVLRAACVLLTATAPIFGQIVAPPTATDVTPVIAPVAPELPDSPAKFPEEKPKEFNPAPMVRVDVLMISALEDKLLQLLPQLRDPAQIEAAERKLLEMIGRKEAYLEGWPELTTFDRVRAVSESIVEQRYPIEFDLAGAARFRPVASDAAPFRDRKVDEAVALARNMGGVVSTTFETRNTGATLEVEPIISPDGKSIELSMVPQLVRFDRYSEFPAGTTEKGEKLTAPQPIFTTTKVSTTLALRNGERRLIHVGKSTVDRTRIDVFILGAQIIPSPANR